MTDTIPGQVYNDLRVQFKKGEAMTYLKELCATLKPEQIEEFTCTAMMAAYQANRAKALDYMLGLPGRHEASLLVKIHLQGMLYEEDKFKKGIKFLEVINKHFPKELITEELKLNKSYKDNASDKFKLEMNNREKEMLYFIISSNLVEKNIKVKKSKI